MWFCRIYLKMRKAFANLLRFWKTSFGCWRTRNYLFSPSVWVQTLEKNTLSLPVKNAMWSVVYFHITLLSSAWAEPRIIDYPQKKFTTWVLSPAMHRVIGVLLKKKIPLKEVFLPEDIIGKCVIREIAEIYQESLFCL